MHSWLRSFYEIEIQLKYSDTIVEGIQAARCFGLPFRDGVLGKTFHRRYVSQLKFGRPVHQKAAPFRACIADYHFT